MKKTFLTFFLITSIFMIDGISQTLTEVIIPQYMQGLNGTNATRVPFAYRVTLSGLTPSATYRYFNGVVIGTDASTSNGAGNVIFAKSTGAFTRTSSVDLATAGRYSEFTTDETGSYTGWFITEPTGNATRFVPGNTIYMRIMLNDGAGGTTVATRLTTTSGVTVINFGTNAAAIEGTGLSGTSFATPKNFIMLYDNETGTGRPITGTFVESDGTANTTANSYVAFYNSNVEAIDGAWGGIIPNILASGIRRIAEYSLSSGSLVNYATDADGVWPSGANTVNPAGATTAIIISSSDAPLPVELTSFTAKQIGTNVQLNWATATEVNSHKYVIEKSNSNNWSAIGEVKANGNSNSAKQYSFTDKITTNGKFQYRLKMIDNDGSFKYSDIVELNVETPKAFELLQNAPNPFNPTTSITYQLANASDVSLKVYDIIGNEVLTLVNEKQDAGKYEVKLDASKLASGTYVYRLSAGSFVQTKKMILLK